MGGRELQTERERYINTQGAGDIERDRVDGTQRRRAGGRADGGI